jgi:hypothetical protein
VQKNNEKRIYKRIGESQGQQSGNEMIRIVKASTPSYTNISVRTNCGGKK